MADEDRVAAEVGVDRGGDRANDVGHVNDRVCRARPPHERQHAESRHAEERQERAIAGAVDDAGTQRDKTQPAHPAQDLLAGELAAAVRGQRTRRIVLAPRCRRGRRPRGGEARDVHEPDARRTRRLRDRARALDVRVDVLALAHGGDDAGEVHDGADVAKHPLERARLERPADRDRFVAARRERRGDVASDEPRRAGDGHSHARRFS